jgi:alanine-glyoxylate transaminase/(R)-3-amino-2-methylpropionate-pyruvate transaminase
MLGFHLLVRQTAGKKTKNRAGTLRLRTALVQHKCHTPIRHVVLVFSNYFQVMLRLAQRFNLRQACRSLATYEEIVSTRWKYMSPSLKTFEAYDQPFVITRGDMQYMYDHQGKKHIDLLGQNITISCGHRHPKIVAAAIAQLEKLPHCSTLYYHEESSMLAKEIVETLPPHPSGHEWVVHFVVTGSEAIDLAAQMARVYTGRNELFALHKAYHGLHGYAAGLTAIGKSHQPNYASSFTGIYHVPPNDIETLRSQIKFGTGGRVAGIFVEPLQGYGGIFPLRQGYLQEAFDEIRAHGGVAIADEVQTGFGRLGEKFWGFQHSNNQAIPDMITMAKGMGNGIGMLAAVACIRPIAEAFAGKMFFNTYGANPTSCAASRAVLRVIKEEKLLENCHKQGLLFTKKLDELCKKYPQALKEVRGTGLFQGLEIAGKTSEDSTKNAIEMHKRIRDYGVVLGRGSAAGNVFRVQPPMCIQSEDVEKVVWSIEEVAKQYIQEKGL